MGRKVVVFHSNDIDSLSYPYEPWTPERVLKELVRSAHDRATGSYSLVALLDNMDDCEHAFALTQNNPASRPWIEQIPDKWLGTGRRERRKARSTKIGDVLMMEVEKGQPMWSLFVVAPKGLDFAGVIVGEQPFI